MPSTRKGPRHSIRVVTGILLSDTVYYIQCQTTKTMFLQISRQQCCLPSTCSTGATRPTRATRRRSELARVVRRSRRRTYILGISGGRSYFDLKYILYQLCVFLSNISMIVSVSCQKSKSFPSKMFKKNPFLSTTNHHIRKRLI